MNDKAGAKGQTAYQQVKQALLDAADQGYRGKPVSGNALVILAGLSDEDRAEFQQMLDEEHAKGTAVRLRELAVYKAGLEGAPYTQAT